MQKSIKQPSLFLVIKSDGTVMQKDGRPSN